MSDWFAECTEEEYDEYRDSPEGIEVYDAGVMAYGQHNIDNQYSKGTKEHYVWGMGRYNQNFN